ncbi:hypothetical protein [Pseudomonas sp. TTU2014-080ASC]|uniref:hypothetical protein n=1 Tax=Pseudomonas sp. TTU2014-080ASC TaxID=1729724 RepID=UPI00128EB79B|nr:hypothetical protein [Pseudomonas sp. TTU2014-080ASC]
MKKQGLLNLLILLLTCHLAFPAQAMSRHHDGEARVWSQDDKLCLGVAPTYKTGGILFSGTAQVNDNDVRLHAISVSAVDKDMWHAYIPPESSAEGVRVTSDTCISYGQSLAGFTTKTPAQPINPGLYSVILEAGDQKNRRARFYLKACISLTQNTWAVTPAKFNENETGSSRFYCD